MKGKAALTVPPTTRKDRRACKHDTSSQIPEMPPQVLGDEEDKQLVTYEKGLVQGCYNRHPAREKTYSLLHACSMHATDILISARLLIISCRMSTMLSIPIPFHKRSLHSQRPAKVAHTLTSEPPQLLRSAH